MCAKNKATLLLSIPELLLRGSPHEYTETRPAGGGLSALERMSSAARRWVDHPSALTDEERARIREVWLEGRYQPPLEMSSGRVKEIRELMVPEGVVR